MRHPDNSIFVHLIGGLGNQMFQYAAARALALRRDAELFLDLSGFERYALRRYELDPFPLAATIAAPPREPKGLGRLLALTGAASVPRYREPHSHYDSKLDAQPLPILLDGYWQSERYFADAAPEIRAELTPLAAMEPENAAMAAKIDAAEAISVHVRRGDYVTNAHTNAYHGTCSLDYYRAAIDLIRQRVERPHLFMFSDDHDWTRANLAFDLPTTYVTANSADRGYRDMQLMSRCRHHVIANSSFSWWGAWLNPSPQKIVVAPARWFAGSDNDTRDLLPADWIRL